MPQLPALGSLKSTVSLIGSVLVALSAALALFGAHVPLPWLVTPTPTPATPTPTNWLQLTQSQINSIEAASLNNGYTVTKHLTYNGENNDGSLLYQGGLTKDNVTYTYALNVYQDSLGTNKGFSNAVKAMQEAGFSGSYTSGTNWAGTMTLPNHVKVGGQITETTSVPYYVSTTLSGT